MYQVDEIGAIPMWIPNNLMFAQNDCTFLVLHKTAGGSSAQEVAAYFQSGSNGFGVSSHYIIGQDGTLVQCVPENMGAGANCCVEPGHAIFIPDSWDGKRDNGNLHTISIEHVDPSTDNSTPLTDIQKQVSFNLIYHICKRHNIPLRYAVADGLGGICCHHDIAPQSRARCPGNYPLAELYTFLRQKIMDERQRQAQTIWASTDKMMKIAYGQSADLTNPIGTAWLQLCIRGLKPGAPVTLPYANIDWSNNPITCQEFTGGFHAEMSQAGKVTFYDPYGNVV